MPSLTHSHPPVLLSSLSRTQAIAHTSHVPMRLLQLAHYILFGLHNMRILHFKPMPCSPDRFEEWCRRLAFVLDPVPPPAVEIGRPPTAQELATIGSVRGAWPGASVVLHALYKCVSDALRQEFDDWDRVDELMHEVQLGRTFELPEALVDALLIFYAERSDDATRRDRRGLMYAHSLYVGNIRFNVGTSALALLAFEVQDYPFYTLSHLVHAISYCLMRTLTHLRVLKSMSVMARNAFRLSLVSFARCAAPTRTSSWCRSV